MLFITDHRVPNPLMVVGSELHQQPMIEVRGSTILI
jgi:hypothetical protein